MFFILHIACSLWAGYILLGPPMWYESMLGHAQNEYSSHSDHNYPCNFILWCAQNVDIKSIKTMRLIKITCKLQYRNQLYIIWPRSHGTLIIGLFFIQLKSLCFLITITLCTCSRNRHRRTFISNAYCYRICMLSSFQQLHSIKLVLFHFQIHYFTMRKNIEMNNPPF